jgi:hypothetical protein
VNRHPHPALICVTVGSSCCSYSGRQTSHIRSLQRLVDGWHVLHPLLTQPLVSRVALGMELSILASALHSCAHCLAAPAACTNVGETKQGNAGVGGYLMLTWNVYRSQVHKSYLPVQGSKRLSSYLIPTPDPFSHPDGSPMHARDPLMAVLRPNMNTQLEQWRTRSPRPIVPPTTCRIYNTMLNCE